MKLPRILVILCLALSFLPTHAAFFEDKSKKEAKELFEKAQKEGNDKALQSQDYCQAAQMEPKEKKYVEACNNSRGGGGGGGGSRDDEATLASAQAAFQNHDLDKAETLAHQIPGNDPKVAGQLRILFENIRNERNSSQSTAAIKAAWEHGDFKAVEYLAEAMTTTAGRAAAVPYLKNVAAYNAYIDAANKAEATNPEAAKEPLGYAYSLNPHGPVDVPARLRAIDVEIANKNNAKYFQTPSTPSAPAKTPKPQDQPSAPPVQTQTASTPPPANSDDLTQKVNGLLSDARNAEKQGNSTLAISDYARVLKLQPGNSEAQASSTRLEQAIKSDPAAALAELKSAIRSFYQAQYDDARRALMDYLESPQTAKNPGAADFYLGATYIERAILRTPAGQLKEPPEDAISAFKAARKASYNPVRAYVSPALLKTWDSTAQ